MGIYKVTFEDNHAIVSTKVDTNKLDSIRIEQANDKLEITYMTIFANSEAKSIERADEIAGQLKDLW